MNKIFILDAVNYLFRSYYAIGPMTNDKGQSTSAVYGFIRSVQKMIKDFAPTYLIAVFDGPDNKKARQAVYAEYKMHRKGAPEDLFPQFDWAWEFCQLAGIPALCIDGVEADDTMASIAVWAKKSFLLILTATAARSAATAAARAFAKEFQANKTCYTNDGINNSSSHIHHSAKHFSNNIVLEKPNQAPVKSPDHQ